MVVPMATGAGLAAFGGFEFGFSRLRADRIFSNDQISIWGGGMGFKSVADSGALSSDYSVVQGHEPVASEQATSREKNEPSAGGNIISRLETLADGTTLAGADGMQGRFRHRMDVGGAAAGIGDEMVRRLPQDIQNLFKVLGTHTLELPSWLAAVAEAHGYRDLAFPCNGLGRFFVKHATAAQLRRRLGAFEAVEGDWGKHAERAAAVVRYFVAFTLAHNVAFAITHTPLQYQYEGPRAAFVHLAHQIVSGFVHVHVYRDLEAISDALGESAKAGREHASVLTDPEQRAIVQSKIEELEGTSALDEGMRLVSTGLSLMLAYQVVSSLASS